MKKRAFQSVPLLFFLLLLFVFHNTIVVDATAAFLTPPARLASNRKCCRVTAATTTATTIPSTTALFYRNSDATSKEGEIAPTTTTTMTRKDDPQQQNLLTPLQAQIAKVTMVSYILSMCLALPATLLPISMLQQVRVFNKEQTEVAALRSAEFWARTLLQIMPFCDLQVITSNNQVNGKDQQQDLPASSSSSSYPTIWVANHVSQIDTFLFLACDHLLRGPDRRPLKVIYWQGLDSNPVSKLLFRLAGFIPVQMAANGNGNKNEYDPHSFKSMLQQTKQALCCSSSSAASNNNNPQYDLFVLPEGQLNPWPEKGLLPVFNGAYFMARMGNNNKNNGNGNGKLRQQNFPIRFVGVHGTQNLWHADDEILDSVPTSRVVKMKAYPLSNELSFFESADEFVQTFRTVVGEFGKSGTDLAASLLEDEETVPFAAAKNNEGTEALSSSFQTLLDTSSSRAVVDGTSKDEKEEEEEDSAAMMMMNKQTSANVRQHRTKIASKEKRRGFAWLPNDDNAGSSSKDEGLRKENKFITDSTAAIAAAAAAAAQDANNNNNNEESELTRSLQTVSDTASSPSTNNNPKSEHRTKIAWNEKRRGF